MMQRYLLLALLSAAPLLGRAQDKPAQASPYDSAHFSWRKPVPRNRLRELQPDRPGVTESPFTVDAGHVQLEMDALRLSNGGRAGEQRTRDWHIGYSMLKLGLSRRTDLQLELPAYAVTKQRPAGAEQWEQRSAGFGDVTLRVKHNFVGDDQQGHFAMSVIGCLRLPTGGLVGDGAVEYGLVLPLDVELSEQLNLEAQLETDFNYDRDAARHYQALQPSLALEWDLTQRLGLLSEGLMRWDNLSHQWQSALTLAPLLKITPNFEVDAGTRLALDRRSEHEYFVGFTLRR